MVGLLRFLLSANSIRLMTIRIGLVQISALFSVCSQVESVANKLSTDSVHNSAENPITTDAGTLPVFLLVETGWLRLLKMEAKDFIGLYSGRIDGNLREICKQGLYKIDLC